MSKTITLETKGLDQLIKALKTKAPEAVVGILGDRNSRNKVARKNSGSAAITNNATIGAIHEFGSAHMPQRSFLRVPISDHLEKVMENSGALDKSTMKDVITSGTILPWMKKITILAEGIVIKAFDTGGYGKWPKWRNPNYTNNGNKILVDTQQLRNSITSECK